MREFDNESLLEDIRERGSLPVSDFRFSDALLLKAATRELRDAVAPLMQQARSEHLVYEYTTPVVSGRSTYRIPERAIGGGGLRDVVFLDTAGTPRSLMELGPEDVVRQGSPSNTGTPYAYYIRNASVVLVPTPNVSGTLSLPYYARPNALAIPDFTVTGLDSYSVISVSDVTGNITILATNPPNNGATVDVIRTNPGFETLVVGATVVFVSSLGGGLHDVTLDQSPVGAGIVTADVMWVAGKAHVPQCPVELHGLLAVRTVRRCLKAVGDVRWRDFDEEAKELEARAVQWLSPRNDGEARAAPSPLATGLLAGILGGSVY